MEISTNVVTIGLIIAWLIGIILWVYLLAVRLPRVQSELKQEIPDMVWESIMNRIRDVKDPDVQEMFNRTAVYMLKAVSEDDTFRNVINGKMKDFAATFTKFFINSLPDTAKQYLTGETPSGGSPGAALNPEILINKLLDKFL